MFRLIALLSSLRFYTWHLLTSITVTPRHRKLEEIRKQWGMAGSRDAWLAGRYFELVAARRGASTYVDGRTWSDLEFPKIFADIDTTITRPGSQYLYSQLRTYPEQPDTASETYRTCRALGQDAALREQIQMTLMYLSPDSCASVAENLFGEPPQSLKHRRFLTFWSVLAFVLALVTIASSLSSIPFSAIPLCIMAGLNIAIIRWMAPEANKLIETLSGIYRLTRVADALSQIQTARDIPQLRELAAARRTHVAARSAFRRFAILERAAISGLPAWLNIFFLWEWLAYMQTLEKLEGIGDELRSMFRLVASLDAAIAIASFLHRHPAHCLPTVSTLPRIEIDAGRHPLLANGVPNSLSLHDRSALVTGSNMAGKTTFIKMIAANLILGRTIGFCLASRAVVPATAVRVCIHNAHSIETGKSHYFAELEVLKAFFEEAGSDTPPVFVIDEPFSGTNTVERIAAAKAVLNALSRRSVVLATTHDVELQEILKDRFDTFHFTEDPDVEGFFDFRIRKGTCNEGNALRLLEKIGFPAAVTREAASFAAGLAGPRGRSLHPAAI